DDTSRGSVSVQFGPESPPLDEQISSNKRRSAVLIFAFVAVVVIVVGAIAALLGAGIVGLIVVLVIAAAASFAAYWKSDALALAIVHAPVADPAAPPRPRDATPS